MGVSLLGKMKLYELAKELNLTSKELLDRAGEIGLELKSHLSTLEDDQIEKLKKSVSSTKSTKKPAPKKEADKKEKSAPVIIRREVIIEDEKKQDDKKAKDTQHKTPFVERNKNKDYNIVYRNKTTKPMTFSELFGIKDNKKETKKKKEENKVETTNKEVQNNTATEVNETKTYKDANSEKTVIANKNEEVKNVTENVIDKNNDKKEKTEIPENKNMEATVKKELGNNNYKRNKN